MIKRVLLMLAHAFSTLLAVKCMTEVGDSKALPNSCGESTVAQMHFLTLTHQRMTKSQAVLMNRQGTSVHTANAAADILLTQQLIAFKLTHGV